MAPVKRQQPHEEPESPPPTATAAPAAAVPDSTRRATRQTPIPPPPIPTAATVSQPQQLAPAAAAHQKQRPGARRPSTTTKPPQPPVLPQVQKISETPIPIPVPPSSLAHPHHSSPFASPAGGSNNSLVTPPDPRAKRRKSSAAAADRPAMVAAAKEAKENVRPVNLVAPKINYQAPQPHRTGGSLVRPSPPTSQPPITSHFRPAPRPLYHHTVPATVTAVPVPIPPTSTPVPRPTPATTTTTTPTPSRPPQPQPQPQPHPQLQQHKQLQHAATTSTKKSKTAKKDKSAPRTDRNIDKVMLGNICFRAWYPSYYGKEVLGDASASAKGGAGSGKNPLANSDLAGGAGAKNNQRKGADAPMLDRLYVCPVCFKYSKELVAWWGHVRMCEATNTVPGKKVYIHPRGRRLVRKEIARLSGKKANVAPKFTEEYVTDEGEWSVWEVDGEQDGLFCQNLSLFAKLFLDNKSVFFDVRGFNYFLLVYTPPPKPNAPGPPPRPHIVGFFSKEKMSWDNNNLACILVFPPWQRKGLGALLMGVSYEISRREGVIGGPEKPISELGRKGYKRFWGGEIARWLLSCPSSTNGGEADPTLLVDVEDCSQATWIAPEDCLATLKDMSIVVEAGKGPGKPPKKKKIEGEGEADEDGDVDMEDGVEEDAEPTPDVPRVKIDKATVAAWVAANKISLERVCDPDGFAEGYAIKEPEVDEESE